jgi:hypothetical protein
LDIQSPKSFRKRFKAYFPFTLPLSQSKQEKRTEGVIPIQRGKDSWNQRPQTSGSLTPPLTRAPPARMPRLHAHYHRPTPPLQRTTAAHAPFAAHPPPLSPTTPFPTPSCTRCRIAPATSSPPLHTRAPPLAYKFPHQLPQSPSRSKQNSPDKIPSTKSQATPFSTPSPLRSQCSVILGLKTVVRGS